MTAGTKSSPTAEAYGQRVSVPSDERIGAIDVVRGAALFGVLTVNLITGFRVSIFTQFFPNAIGAEGPDAAVERFVAFALESKAFALFSLLFGIGLAIQFERLSQSGRADYFLLRRLAALLGFGLLHLVFIWNGDILAEYAVAGLLVLPFLRLPPASLGKAAAVFFLIFFGFAFVPQPVTLPDAAALQRHVSAATDVYANASYWEVLKFSVKELGLMLPLHINVFPRTVALMLLGASIWKSGLLRHSSEYRYEIWIFAVLATTLGVALTLMTRAPVISGMVAPIVLTLGYGSVVYSIATLGAFRFILRPIAALGRMAFTNYILQSVVFCFVFFGFGLGQFGKMGAARALLLGCVVYVAQAIFSTLWLRYYRFGPLEWLWRVLMYGQRVPMWRA
jgi:uncharacterized protein